MNIKGAAAVAAWWLIFFVSCFVAALIGGLCSYITYATIRRLRFIYIEVYGTVSYYGSEADRIALEPKLADYLDVTFCILVIEVLIIFSLGIGIFVSWRNAKWPRSHRRLYPFHPFSSHPEFICHTWVRRHLKSVYQSWSQYFSSYFHHELIFANTKCDVSEIQADFPANQNYLFVFQGDSSGLWCSFCARPCDDVLSTPMRQFFEQHVIFGLDFGITATTTPQKQYAFAIHIHSAWFYLPIWREVLLWLGFRKRTQNILCASLRKGDIDDPSTQKGKPTHLSRISCLTLGYNQRLPREIIALCADLGVALVPVATFAKPSSGQYQRHWYSTTLWKRLWRLNQKVITVVGHPLTVPKSVKGNPNAEAAITLGFSDALNKLQRDLVK